MGLNEEPITTEARTSDPRGDERNSLLSGAGISCYALSIVRERSRQLLCLLGSRPQLTNTLDDAALDTKRRPGGRAGLGRSCIDAEVSHFLRRREALEQG